MKKLVLLLTAVLCGINLLAQTAVAPVVTVKPIDEKHKQLAEQLLIVTKANENLTKMMALIKSKQMAAFTKQLSGAQLQNAEEIAKAVGAILDQELCWDKLKEPLVTTYAESFSKEELEGLIKFYESPIGRKIVEKQPEIQTKSMAMMQGLFQQIMPKIMNVTKELVEKQKAAAKATETKASNDATKTITATPTPAANQVPAK
jgi:hypothetical protein